MNNNEATVEQINREIFDFMGCQHSEHEDIDVWEMKRLQYHESWDALMPVVEKIEEHGFCIFIQNDACWIKPGRAGLRYRYSDSVLSDIGKIDATYQIVNQFIQWYNQQTKP